MEERAMQKARRREGVRGFLAYPTRVTFRGKQYHVYEGDILRLSTATRKAKMLKEKGYKVHIRRKSGIPPIYIIYTRPIFRG